MMRVGSGSHVRLILGGVHGDEPKGVTLARRLCEVLSDGHAVPGGASLAIIPVVNPDGYAVRRRRNARGVDLNRNFPTEDWLQVSRRARYFGGTAAASEPETRVVVEVIETLRPTDIVAIHSISKHRHCNNRNGPAGPATEMARAMAACNRYPINDHIGYPTPGSLGTWAGDGLGIPVLTLELPSHHSPRRCWEDNRAALLAGLPA